MTQEQKITKGTIIIFVLSIVLLICLCATAVLAYFAGSQENKTTLIMGGPVRVSLVDKDYEDSSGQGNMVMTIKAGQGMDSQTTLLPGMGIDMQAIAKITSSDINATNALLRAILTIEVSGLKDNLAADVEKQIRESPLLCDLNIFIEILRRGITHPNGRAIQPAAAAALYAAR